jgi:hypothetical protein
MKANLKSVLAALVAGAILILSSGCATTGAGSGTAAVENSVKYLEPSASVLATGFLISTKDPAERAHRASYLYAIATGVRTLASDQPVTAEEFQKTILAFAPKADPEFVSLVASLTSIYNSARAKVAGNASAYLKALEAIARGVEASAAPYVKKTAVLNFMPSQDEMEWLFDGDPDEYNDGTMWATTSGSRSNLLVL